MKMYNKQEFIYRNDAPILGPKPSCLWAKIVSVSFLIGWAMIFYYSNDVEIIYIDYFKPIRNVGPYFNSFALDSDIIANKFLSFNTSDPKLMNLVTLLGPAYMRIGGNRADQLIFAEDEILNSNEFYLRYLRLLYEQNCDSDARSCGWSNFTFNGRDWLNINNFARKTNKFIIFDLNALLRNADGSWNSENAEQLMRFSDKHGLLLNWELGNEPNAFEHVFQKAIPARQLAKDFMSLRSLLSKFTIYNHSLLLGPDTTRPISINSGSSKYLKEFLSTWNSQVDAITWHQYYMDGQIANIEDFTEPIVFELFERQIKLLKQIVENAGLIETPVWLGETGSAYGGGAPNLSDRFAASFIWVDKLGLAAKYGIKTVIRQSVFGRNYGLIDANYNPNPDWWVNILYNRFVGRRVLTCSRPSDRKLRFYCHCTPGERQNNNLTSITVFGMNMHSYPVKVRLQCKSDNLHPIDKKIPLNEYILTTNDGLQSKKVLLNGQTLKLTSNGNLPPFIPTITVLRDIHTIPAYSIVFWVAHELQVPACSDTFPV